MKKNEEMITQSTVLKMGWTKSMVDELLPEPVLKTNPHYKCAAPMRLYRKSDVLAIMETQEYEIAREKAKKRKESAAKGKQTKIKNLSEKMKHFAETINVTVLPEDELIARTIEAKRQWYDYCWKEFDENVDSEPLKRWVVNYIRHNLVRYDDGLYEMRGKTGQDVVYPEFKDAILDKIALAYPTYADECEKQKIC